MTDFFLQVQLHDKFDDLPLRAVLWVRLLPVHSAVAVDWANRQGSNRSQASPQRSRSRCSCCRRGCRSSIPLALARRTRGRSSGKQDDKRLHVVALALFRGADCPPCRLERVLLPISHDPAQVAPACVLQHIAKLQTLMHFLPSALRFAGASPH